MWSRSCSAARTRAARPAPTPTSTWVSTTGRQARPISTRSALAGGLSATPHPVVTGFQEWGCWVNGGGWLTVEGQRLDFLYRNLDRVERVIADCENGETINDFWQQ